MTERQSEPKCRENYVYVHVAYHTSGQKCCKKADNKSFKNVAKFRHFGMTVTNQPSIHKEIEGRLNSVVSLPIRIKIYKTIILPTVLHGCEIWSFTLREEYGFKVFENRMFMRISGPEKDEES